VSTYADGYHGAEENPHYELTAQEQDLTPTLAEPHPELYSFAVAENGEYPAVIHEAEEGCKPCDVSAEFYARLYAENDARWKAEQKALEAQRSEPEAGL